jgi:predicted enzyme related to lactoylglutathione lyase
MASQLVWFELPVADVERGRRFFGELMGWRLESWGDQPYHLVADASPGGALMPGDGRPVVYFSTPDIDASVAQVRALGGEADDIQEVPGVGRMTSCRDDQGTRFSLYEAG